MAQITKEELLEKLFHDDYEHLKGKRLRMTRVRVPGKEVCMAHIISTADACVYQNLALHIGVHEGEDHTGESIGLLDRFCGTLIVLGDLVSVQTAVEEVVRFFSENLGFRTCAVHRS